MEVYETVKVIAALLHRHPRTISKWIEKHGFPTCKLPNGNVATTDMLINQWILARGDLYRKAKEAAKLVPSSGQPIVSEALSKEHSKP